MIRTRLRAAVAVAMLCGAQAALAVPQAIDFENTIVASTFTSSFQQDSFNFVLTGGAPPTWSTAFGAPLVGTGIRAFSGGANDAQQGTITRVGGGTFTMTSLIVVNYSTSASLTVRAFNGASQVFTQAIAANGSATVNFGNVVATEVRLNGNSASSGGNFGASFAFDNFTIDVPNLAPTLGNISANTASYTQGGAAVVLDTGTALTIADADSADFNGGRLSLAFSGGSVAAEDVLEVGAVGPITLSGVDVVHSGTTIGSITGSGIGGNALVVTLNANATIARTQDLARAIRYRNTNATSPGVNLRAVTWTLEDGDGAPPRSVRSGVRVFPLIASGSVVRVEFSGATPPNPAFTGFPKQFTAGGFTFRTGDGNNATNCDAGCFTSSADAPNAPGAQIQANGLAGITTTIRRTDNATFTLVSLVVGNRSSANVTVTARNGASVLDTRVLPGGAAQQLAFPNLTVDEVRVVGNSTVTGNLVQGWIDDLMVAVANVPPAINGLAGDAATYTQLGAAVPLDQGTAATVVDPDSANFNGGSLSASITGNPWVGQDVLAVGTIGGISVSGANVIDAGTTIGTIVANGSGGNPLTINFNANATPARVQNLVRALTYSNSNTNTGSGAQGPDLGDRTVQVLLGDGGGAPPGSITTTVRVRPAALAPNNVVQVNFNGLSIVGTPNSVAFQNHTFVLAGGAQPNVSVGFLTPTGPSLRAQATEIVNQTLTIRRADNASFLLQSLIVANLSLEAGRAINTFNGSTLVQSISLPARGTQRVVFSTAAVTRIEISGSTGLTTAGLVEVDDLAVFVPNTAPTLTLDAAGAGWNEDATPTAVSPGATATDAEANWTGGTLAVSITSNASAQDRLSIGTGSGLAVAGTNLNEGATTFATLSVAGGQVTGSTTLTATFNANATSARVQALVRAIQFDNSSQAPVGSTRIVGFVLTDGGALSANASRPLTVVPINDAPVVTAPATANVYVTTITPIAGITLDDVDAGAANVQLDATTVDLLLSSPGTAGVTVTGNNTSALRLAGPLAALNALLASGGLRAEVPPTGVPTPLALQLVVNDLGNSGNGGPQTSQRTIDLAVLIPQPTDLRITLTNGVGFVTNGQPVAYTMEVANLGPTAASGATVQFAPNPALFGATWTCAAAPGSGAACGAASGAGLPSTTVSLPVGASATYVVNATIAVVNEQPLQATASIAVPVGLVDGVSANNTATDTDQVGLFRDGFESP